MNPVKIILGLIPFAVFSIAANALPVGWAALIGLAASVIALVADLKGGVKALPVVGVVIMGGFAVAGFLAGPAVQAVLGEYARGLATLLLGVYILVTAWFAPFTASYARETVPSQYWTTPFFRRVNRTISAVWGLAVLAMAVLHLVASAIEVSGERVPLGPVILNWGLPILIILGTIKLTSRLAGSKPSSEATPSGSSPAHVDAN
jgi:hypothetical protein